MAVGGAPGTVRGRRLGGREGMLADASLASGERAGRWRPRPRPDRGSVPGPGGVTAAARARCLRRRAATPVGSGLPHDGIAADAEDVVQDAWLRWSGADHAAIDNPAAWLTTVTTRLEPGPAQGHASGAGPTTWASGCPSRWPPGAAPRRRAELAESLTLGFLVLLDRLGPAGAGGVPAGRRVRRALSPTSPPAVGKSEGRAARSPAEPATRFEAPTSRTVVRHQPRPRCWASS